MKTSMDAIQFGKWISERRRKYGWSSQRALVETIRQDPMLQEWRISEDFLARLEAGRLVYPFRGYVRLQILALAWLLCKTVRELHTYLQAASLKDLSSDEAEMVQRLQKQLSIHHSVSIELLPIRPNRLIGRDALLDDMLHHLGKLDRGLYAITGMPGVGKSVLAHEVLHRMATLEHRRFFQDGIISLSCRGRHGTTGLLALLHEIIKLFAATPQPQSQSRSASAKDKNERNTERDRKKYVTDHSKDGVDTLPGSPVDLADTIDYVRILLADKSVLFLLDDVEPQFLLHEALDALLGYAQNGSQHAGSASARRIVLTTSRHIPEPALVNYYCPVEPLQHEDGMALFHLLIKGVRGTAIEMNAQEHAYIEQICSALGNLPLAIERAADVVAIEGVPLALLAANVAVDPLSSLLDSDEKLFQTFEQALQVSGPERQTFFALLALPSLRVITLEEVAALYATATSDKEPRTLPALTTAAVMLGRFVGHSLLLRVNGEEQIYQNNPRYRMHPLLYAYARKLLQLQPSETAMAARN